MAGENPAQSAALLGERLFGVHLNDGHSRIGAEDGLMVGSVDQGCFRSVVSVPEGVRYFGVLGSRCGVLARSPS